MAKNGGAKRVYGLGRLKSGMMNQTESAYAEQLKLMQDAGIILWWKFEGLKFKLADKTFYTPDFVVLCADGTLEAHEVKGYWMDDAKVKIKVASAMFPIRFVAVYAKAKRDGGGWRIEKF